MGKVIAVKPENSNNISVSASLRSIGTRQNRRHSAM
jgi:hypothetical protein